MDQRAEALQQWLVDDLNLDVKSIKPASDDASFRRYFRVDLGNVTRIAMDAPPEKEDCDPFVTISNALHEIGVHVPEVIEANLEQGFLLLSDLGDRVYLDQLDNNSVERLYGDALRTLMVIQAAGPIDDRLPAYNEALLLTEMSLFRDWFLQTHLDMALSDEVISELGSQFQLLANVALEQPRVCVHRDFHSRNLMQTEVNNPGVLDFQDAVVGPITYDLVSLLRDCYIDWPRERVEYWAMGYYELAVQSGLLQEEHEDEFLRWFDWMGVQRHLKAIGIFARLNHRDGKPGYLHDIPRTLRYVQEVTSRYDALAPLHRLIGAI
ncbi:MAG TPA: aminoglycoside phosphotransferase [Chromatiales bacterium]|jgi:aminoglycoside/choline kinase family phosphotransferase|nr:aminoglycoside phosphotransferase [Chromatiaceae bacterium]HIO14817.1 aminoglycoside phosphotransferase [Chromatiales bacterium]HIO55219.1 aminoglycoside phosphotransferase [Chromatiales bacterium]